ncbi:NTP transferase domain-containing protein [Halobaculum sp. P14]|uniref:NTP transferase domain-containing protein n=1 Tax=Halobaculum sp. P14 TaxID=3421638 RepID=UPI003EBDA8A5
MCGGRGTRLDADAEKPLFAVGGAPMVDRVCDALAAADRVDAVSAAVSPHTPDTRDRLADDDAVSVIRTPGDGYVADLQAALDATGTPVLTVAADLPLLAGDAVDAMLAAADGSTTVRVPAALKRELGVSVDSADSVDAGDAGDAGDAAGGDDADAAAAWVPTGVNVVAADGDTAVRSYDARLAVNVNRRADAAVAERLLAARRAPAGGEVADGP